VDLVDFLLSAHGNCLSRLQVRVCTRRIGKPHQIHHLHSRWSLSPARMEGPVRWVISEVYVVKPLLRKQAVEHTDALPKITPLRPYEAGQRDWTCSGWVLATLPLKGGRSGIGKRFR
jgi:hypothetical protein